MSRYLSATEMAVLVSLLNGPKFPAKEFIRSGYSFAEVYAMAAWLRRYFAGPGNATETVCLATENRGIMAASLLASLAGGPVLLLPFAFSGQALAGIQKATGFQTAIADTTSALPSGIKVICPQAATSPPNQPATALSPESELLRIFTGGTTAMPQVWSKTAANIFREALFLAEWLGITENDCIVATISPYHIYGLLFSVALPLVSSATVLDGTPSFPGEIINAVQEQSGTLLVSVPAHYRALRGKKTSAGTLRLAVSSAGMLEKADNDDFARQNRIGLVEIYGATETGGIASRNRFLGEEQFTVFPAVEWKISGRRLSVRSPYISPDASCDELGFFLTGDLVEPFGEKSFSLQGRVDNITKVGGKRVNLEGIRTIIQQQPGVKDSVALALPEAGGREHRIVALVQGNCAPDKIRTALAAALEPYALPRLIKVVGQIPVKKNGKYDREAILRLLST